MFVRVSICYVISNDAFIFTGHEWEGNFRIMLSVTMLVADNSAIMASFVVLMLSFEIALEI